MLFLPQGANNQSKSSFKTKPNKKDWQKISFPTPIWENPNYEHKNPQKHNLRIKINKKNVKDYLRDVNGMRNTWI